MVGLFVKSVILVSTEVDVAYLPFFVLLPIAVLLAGSGAGYILTLVSAMIDAFVLQTPTWSLPLLDSAAVLRLALFIPIGLWLSYLIGAVSRSRRDASQAAGRLARFLDAMPDPSFIVEPASARIEEANEAAQTRSEGLALVGREITSLIPGLVLEETGPIRPVTLGLALRSGEEIPVEVIVRSVDLPGGQHRFLVSAHDIHDRIDAEIRLVRMAQAERTHAETLSTVLATIDDGIALFGPDDRLITANDGLARLLGGPAATGAELMTALNGERDGDEIRVERDGRWVRITERPVDGGGGQRVTLVRDVTREREAVAARDAFLGVLSHELRTPVTTIFGLAHVLGRSIERGSPPPLDLVADVTAEAQRLNELIEDLLVLSRAEVGSVVVDPEPVLLSRVIDEVVAAERTRHPNVSFEVDAPAGLPPASGDRTFVGQVLRNLVGNAAKYGPRTACVVRIVMSLEGEALIVRILDQGPGFDPNDGPHLFDIFFRGDRTARQQSGSGIGLYVTRILVSAMSGRVWARLNDDVGSEFGFSLPALAPDQGDLPAASVPA
ncbi:MAG: ATP-binding protein, partial [Chloroflexota bacterium]|nr:ATP-binding protein [Chloroflexota bacterium]